MRAFDSVILNVDLPAHSIRAGTVGVIVEHLSDEQSVFLVECFDKDGKTIDVVQVETEQITVTLADFFDGDLVALLDDFPAQHLVRGQVGTIRQRLGVGIYHVSFVDTVSAITRLVTLHAKQMLLLHWQSAETSA